MKNPLFNQLFKFVKQRMSYAYYQGRESIFGHHKRDIVVLQVEQACHSLKQSRSQFEDTLEQFKTVVHVADTSLEHRYKQLKRQFDCCQNKANEVSDRITAIEQVSGALFKEWEDELGHYSNRTLRSRSRQQLKTATQQYSRLIKTMRKAESRTQPVLAAFQDQVLFFKHNLNAQAIAALQHEFIEISVDISRLIEVMEVTINEASDFVSSLTEQKALPAPK